jgi:hypothetical protein
VSDEEQEAGGTQQETGAPDPLTVGELITLAEAAEYSGLSKNSLLVYAKNGRLKARKRGWMWFTTYAAVDEYLTSRSLDNIPKKYRDQS